jgi:hypothetical protein
MQKQKKEDFRIEEELRAQRIKYEESSDDVYRRMGEIQDSEAESMADLGAFLDAELEYYDRCRDIFANLRRQWPAGGQQPKLRDRSRSTTAHSFGNGGAREESPPPPMPEAEIRPAIGSRVKTSDRAPPNGGFRLPNPDGTRLSSKPAFHRTQTSPMTFEGPTTAERMSRTRSDQGEVPPPLPRNRPFVFESYENENTSSPSARDRYGYDRSESPARSIGSTTSRVVSRSSSNNALANAYNLNSTRKQPPPPPPPGARKKPPPPPPKRVNPA